MTPGTAALDDLAQQFCSVRQQMLSFCQLLTPEDMMVQSWAEASPGKWHMAHTTWFYETFILSQFRPTIGLSTLILFGSSTAITTPWRNTRRKSCAHRSHVLRSMPSWRIANMLTLQWISCSLRPGGRSPRTPGARHQPRTATPGTAGHRHQACASGQIPSTPRTPAKRRCRRQQAAPTLRWYPSRVGCATSASRARASVR